MNSNNSRLENFVRYNLAGLPAMREMKLTFITHVIRVASSFTPAGTAPVRYDS